MLKFSCEKALLQAAASTASRAVAAKSSIPALEGLLLEGGRELTLSGYNTQTGIRTSLEAQIREEGRIVLNARLFGDIIRRMPDDVIVFSADWLPTDCTEVLDLLVSFGLAETADELLYD